MARHSSHSVTPSQRRLRDLMTTPPRAHHLLVAALCFIVGFAMVTQIRIGRSDPLEGLNEDELVTVLDQLTQSENQLRNERADLALQKQRLESAQSQADAAREAAQAEHQQMAILAGTVPVEGPGLMMTVVEGSEPIKPQTFVTVLGELRNAGAEAIDINGQRVSVSTFFTSSPSGIAVSGVEITSPYRWSIIGDANTIQPALEIARGAAAQLRVSGAEVEFRRMPTIVINSVVEPKSYEYATVDQ